MKCLGDFGEATQEDMLATDTVVNEKPVDDGQDVVAYDDQGNPLVAVIENGKMILKPKELAQNEGDYVFKEKLIFGSQGQDVLKIQEILDNLNYYAGKHDGIFGFEMLKAVKGFQRDMGIEATGQIDANTWNTITSPAVEVAQENIKTEKVQVEKKSNRNRALMGVGAIAAVYLATKE
jgi:hypothetical protein